MVLETAEDLCSEFVEALRDTGFLPQAASKRSRGKTVWLVPEEYDENGNNIRVRLTDDIRFVV